MTDELKHLRTHTVKVYFFFALLLGTLGLTFLIFSSFIAALAVALTFAVLFSPIYLWLKNRIRSETFSAFLTVSLVIVCILLPIIFISFKVASELHMVVSGLHQGTVSFAKINSFVNEHVGSFYPNFAFRIEDSISGYASKLAGNVGGIFARFIALSADLFVFVLGLFYFLKDGKKLKERMVELSPLPDKDDRAIFKHMERSINAVIRGYIFVSLIQGFLVTVSFLIFHVPNPALWGVLTVFVSLVPTLGVPFIYLPTVAYLFFSGHAVGAIGLLIWFACVVAFIDNYLNPKIIGRGVHIHQFLILLSVLGGIIFFGPAGFLLGPIILSFLFSLLDIYSEGFSTEPLIEVKS
jgi:predicted PurR-regulated permease PerM